MLKHHESTLEIFIRHHQRKALMVTKHSFVFFLSGFSFTNTENPQGSMGGERAIFYSTLSLALTQENSDIYL